MQVGSNSILCNEGFFQICGKKVLYIDFLPSIMATLQKYNDIYILKNNRTTKF
jgi:hypothetical protein